VLHHGQICFSTERILVHAKIADKFKELLTAGFQHANIPGNTAVTRRIAEHAVDVLDDAKSKGVEFLVGGDVPSFGDQVPSLKPAIVLEPKKDAMIFDEETFGPSVSLCEYPYLAHCCLGLLEI
jgi:acyl-CoA reductase-like NAD-dependent aldehyde dehydrogenase